MDRSTGPQKSLIGNQDMMHRHAMTVNILIDVNIRGMPLSIPTIVN